MHLFLNTGSGIVLNTKSNRKIQIKAALVYKPYWGSRKKKVATCSPHGTPIVADIINKSLSCGIIPQCFKHALVKSLLKKASLHPKCLRNYRPVSSLPFLSKVLERIV